MNFEKYKNKNPSPIPPQKPRLKDDPTSDEVEVFLELIRRYEKDHTIYIERLQEYKRERFALKEQFKKDLFDELNISENPKREILFEKAWDLGHDLGYSEVYSYAMDLIELII